jgi:hypothetical protein
MTTIHLTVIECQPEAADDDRKTIITEKCVGVVNSNYNLAKVLQENMLAKQAMEIQELCLLLDDHHRTRKGWY